MMLGMTRAMLRSAPLLGLLMLTPACFDDADGVPECTEGTKGCSCLELQCEAGLMCANATCVDAVGSTETDVGGDTLVSMDTTAGPMTSADSTTGPGAVDESSTAVPPTTSGSGSGSESAGTSSTGAVDLCGNDQLDPDEECDGTPGCEDTCELTNYECNPLNNAPCPDGFKCSIVEEPMMPINAVCLPFAEPPPGELFESNCFFDGAPHDEWCDVGLACALSSSTDACDVNCCVEFCDLTDLDFSCTFAGDVCTAFFTPVAPTGLAQLGYCIGP